MNYSNYMHMGYGYGPDFGLIAAAAPFILVLLLWSLFWKIIGTWNAAKHGHKGWFIAILFLNTCGILEIIYLIFILKMKWSEIWASFK
jgi:hypothetical protein